MRILLINDYGTPTGGAEISFLSLRDGLRRRGHDARLFTSSARPGLQNYLSDYICLGTTSSFRTMLQAANPWAFLKLHRILKEFKPHVVHVKIFLTQLSPLILPLLKEVPALYSVAWYRPICPLGTKLLSDGTPCKIQAGIGCYQNRCLPLYDWFPLIFQMKLWQRWHHTFKLIAADSEAIRQSLMAGGIEVGEVVYFGVPVRPMRPPLLSPPTVVFAGRLVQEKGVDVLLHAFSKVVRSIPEAKLLIAGDGPERKYLENLISNLEINSGVTLLGHLPRSEMEARFDIAWVQAVPSRWAEPFGLVAAEAMMRGTAVVASSVGGLTEIVRNGQTGFLVPPEDGDTLAEALLNLFQNRELTEEMGRTGREIALRKFSEEVSLKKFINLYQEILSRRKE